MEEILQQYRDLIYSIDHDIIIDEWLKYGDFMLLISLRASLEEASEEYASDIKEIDEEFAMIVTSDQLDQLEREAQDQPVSEWWSN